MDSLLIFAVTLSSAFWGR